MVGLSERALDNYLFARTTIGRDYELRRRAGNRVAESSQLARPKRNFAIGVATSMGRPPARRIAGPEGKRARRRQTRPTMPRAAA